MTPKELFLFDLWGYVVIEDVLTPEEVAAANAAVEHHLDLVQKREPGLSQGADTLIAATGRGEFSQNPLTFERPWCEPFRRMLVNERIVGLFNEILGTGFRLDHGPGLIQMDDETEAETDASAAPPAAEAAEADRRLVGPSDTLGTREGEVLLRSPAPLAPRPRY